MNSVIEDTNGIYVYMWYDTLGNFEKNSGKSFDNISLDKDVLVIYYVDSENKSKWELVMAKDQKEFERTHNVITGKDSIFDFCDRYNNARNQSLVDCLKLG